MIESSSIDDLKSRLDVVDVIGEYLELKKSGANFKANCPFHGENTPSFVVSPSKQIYHCFGCGVGGDSIKFVMEMEKLNYPEAIEKLANKLNVTLRYTKNDQKVNQQKRVLEELNSNFRRELNQNDFAKEYLKKRGIYESSIEKFELGYAPSAVSSLNLVKGLNVSSTEALGLGIVALNDNQKPYARFIDRITFPIFNSGGKIVGFGGRTISNHPAKYINSPQSRVFDKSKLLYGYHKARSSIAKLGEVIVCEGYIDVIMLHQAGFENSIATLGTALTSSHIPLLLKGSTKVIVAYDGDRAGLEAAFKAAKMLSSKGAKGGVVIFGDNQDPADMVQKHRLQDLKELFAKPKGFIEFCFEQIALQYDLTDPLQKKDAFERANSYLKTLPPIIQDEYKPYVSMAFKVDQRYINISNSEQALNQKVTIDKEDMSELSMIKTFLTHNNLINTLLNMVDETVFKIHHYEFNLILQNNFEHPKILSILLREDIKELSENELINQIKKQLIIKNRDKLEQVKANKSLSFDKKSFLLRKINEDIKRLTKEDLILK
jgi:DNA primase